MGPNGDTPGALAGGLKITGGAIVKPGVATAHGLELAPWPTRWLDPPPGMSRYSLAALAPRRDKPTVLSSMPHGDP
jgi:hypothetical protein